MAFGNGRLKETYLQEIPVFPSCGLSQFLREREDVDHLVVGQVRECSCVVCSEVTSGQLVIRQREKGRLTFRNHQAVFRWHSRRE